MLWEPPYGTDESSEASDTSVAPGNETGRRHGPAKAEVRGTQSTLNRGIPRVPRLLPGNAFLEVLPPHRNRILLGAGPRIETAVSVPPIMSTMGQSVDRSRSMRRFLVSRPPPKPIREPSLPIHRWHGTMMGIGFFPLAPPTALTALGLPIASARVL